MRPWSTVPVLVCLALGARAVPARASDIRNAADAEALCRTATAEPAEGTGEGYDPLVRTRQRHDYVLARQAHLMDIYSVTLDTTQYRFLDSEPGVLMVDALNPFPLFDGVYTLDLGRTVDISFTVDGSAQDAILAGVASDQVLLRLTFQLVSIDDPWSAYCQPEGASTAILGRLLAAELVPRDADQAMAVAETDRYRSGEVRFVVHIGRPYVPPQPRVQVTSTAFPDGQPPAGEAQLLPMEAETKLSPCYLQALMVNGRLQGAVVIQSQVGQDGHVQDSVVTIDALDQPMLTGCAVGALGQISLPRTQEWPDYEVRMTVIFRLE